MSTEVKRPTDAIEIFKLNVDAFPSNEGALSGLAESAMGAGRTELAIEAYSRVLELNPANADAAKKLKTLVK